MSYFRKQQAPPVAQQHKRIVSQSFYRNPSSNEHRFTMNSRVTPEPKLNKSFVTETGQPPSDFAASNQRSQNTLNVEFQETPMMNNSFTLQTLKKSSPLQQSAFDFKSVKSRAIQQAPKPQGDFQKFHHILEEKNEQVQEWMSRYITLEQKLNNDLQTYKEEIYYQLQMEFRKKQEELNILRLNTKNEKKLIQEELNSQLQKVQLMEAEKRELIQQLNNHKAFTQTKFYRDIEAGKRDSFNSKHKQDIERLEELLEQSNHKVKELQMQNEYLKHQNDHIGVKHDQHHRQLQEQEESKYMQQIDQLKQQLQSAHHDKHQHQDFLHKIKQEVQELKDKERHYHQRVNELEEHLKKKQEMLEKMKRMNEEELEELQQNFEHRKSKDMQTICKLMQDKKELNQELEQKKSQLSGVQNQLEIYQNEIQNLKNTFQRRASEENHDLKLLAVQNNVEERLAAMQVYYDKLKRDNEDDLERLHQQHEIQQKQMNQQIDQLRQKLDEQTKVHDQQDRVREDRENLMLNEISTLKIHNRDIQDELQRAREQVQDLQIQLEEERQQKLVEGDEQE